MYTNAALMFLYAETPLHVGSGSSLSVIDLPIQREKYTNFPTVPGSGLKGAVRERFEAQENDAGKSRIDTAFGPEDAEVGHAGALSFTDARILLFPVRSMKGVFAYITCPLALSRLQRDLELAGKTSGWKEPYANKGQVLGTEPCELAIESNRNGAPATEVVLEEYAFKFSASADVGAVASWLSQNAIPSASGGETFWQRKVKNSLLVLDDDDFRDFVDHSTEVQARIKLNKKKTTTGDGGNLFYEENLPPETLLYALTLASIPHNENPPPGMGTSREILDYLKTLHAKRLQIGGDSSIGKGIVNVIFF